MLEHLATLTKLIKLDLENGPFLTGGYSTWLVENRYNVPAWSPNDIDICCRSIKQFNDVKRILEPLATQTRVSNWLGTGSTYWTINDFQFQAFVHSVTVNERLSWADFTVTAIASDGVNFLMRDGTLEDIQNKILRININNPWEHRDINSQLERYTKYLHRGYRDIDRLIITGINETFATNL
jgi:hypothetical protein